MFVLLLALLDGERHGYGLARDVAELTGGAVRLGPGTLYRSLQRMQVDGLVEPIDDVPAGDPAEGPPDGRSERRRSYRITQAGRQAAGAEARWLGLLVRAAERRGLLASRATDPADREITVPKQDDYCAITPHLVVRNGREAMEFYKKAFGADVLQFSEGPDGRLWVCELLIYRGRVMVNEEFPDMGLLSPTSLGGASVQMYTYVDDADAAYHKAVKAGAISVTEPMDAFWGDRYSQVQDANGHRWEFATKREDLSPREHKERQQDYNASHRGIHTPEEARPEAAVRALKKR